MEFLDDDDDELMSQTRRIESVDAMLEQALAKVEKGLQIEGHNFTHQALLSPVLIGRDPTCELTIKEGSVSRIHAIIYKFGAHYVIRDLNSTNGVYLNDVQVYQAPIRPEDKIRVGDYELNLAVGRPNTQSYSKDGVVMFMDIAGSTRLSEEYGEEFSIYIQQELSKLENKIFTLLGCPVKHLGDGLMCAFGIWPVSSSNYSPVTQALKAARIAVKQIEKKPRYPGIHLRVGLAFGDVTIAKKESFDLLGDTVNLASRLEYSNKLYGTRIMMSERCVKSLGNYAPLREIDTVRVYGKNEPVVIYTWDEHTSQDMRHVYHQGLQSYRKGEFENALKAFEQAALEKDKPSQYMASRCEYLIHNSPDKWDGVWNLDKD